ncbi:MAG TPA: chemotaxis protein CheB, partial [Janthinobacterium sp.]|nr:chemotaxis protein CheB [Janthinobacterium sp.]
MHKIIVIGTSSGGLDALKKIIGALPSDFPAAIFIVMHIGARPSILPELLSKVSALPIRHACDGEPVRPSTILIAPPDRHLMLAGGSVTLSHGPKENHTRPAIDPLFRSAAAEYGARVTGIVLTGYLDDGTAGLKAVKACGGMSVVQDPAQALAPDMPASAQANVDIDMVLPLDDIGPALVRMAVHAAQHDLQVNQYRAPVADWITTENRFSRGQADMEDLNGIASPSTFTCPECQGALWEVREGSPRRFRCHT